MKKSKASLQASTIKALRKEIEALKSKPVSVTVPPIEWGEWKDLHSIVEIRWSKCKKYKLTRIGKSLNILNSANNKPD